MAGRPRRAGRAREEHGFTFIELMTVMLLITILGAIGLVTFRGQKDKAGDATVISLVRSGVTAIESHFTEHQTYDTTPGALIAEEPALAEARNLTVTGDRSTFVITADAADGRTFGFERLAAGENRRFCTPIGEGVCRNDGTW